MFEPSVIPRVFGLPPGVDFPHMLAAGVRARMAGQPPEAMALVTIYLNTARMRERVQAAFVAAGAGFLPRLLVLTDIGADPAFDAPPAVPKIRRRLELSWPVARLVAAEPRFAPGSAVYDLADSLALLAEEMQDEGVTPKAFENPAMAEDHAAHWERSLGFLRIIAPWFDSDAQPDAATRQRLALAALIARWRASPPTQPVLVAGSTGSRGTTQSLMRAVASLPQGALILPGFDDEMPDFGWDSLFSSPVPNEDHPQYRFAHLMASLGIGPNQIAPWADTGAYDPLRNRLVSLALRPAPVTDHWLTEGAALGPLLPATAGMTLVEAPDPRQEALAIALILRKAAADGQRATLVASDRTMARRVTAALDRWGLTPDDSAGRPLHLSAPGRFLRQIAGLFGRPLTVEGLLALLKHPVTCTGGSDRGGHLRHTRDLELRLRRHGPAFPDAAALTGWARATDDPTLHGWADWLAAVLACLPTADDRPVSAWLDTLLALADRIASGPDGGAATGELWKKAAGEAASAAMAMLRDEAPFGGVMSPSDFAALLLRVLEDGSVPADAPGHPLIAIQGPREARELQADLVILGGLTEGVWPAAAAPDPWMSRQMRLTAGLLLPERQIGLAAHDFQVAVAAPRVVLTRALRDDEAETIAARWLDRLKNLIGGLSGGADALAGMRARGQEWLTLAAALEAVSAPAPCPRPAPRPPVDTRPRELPVTAIRTLIRDPYAVYARYILRLRPLDPLQPAPDPRVRGMVLHRIVEDFVRDRPEDEPFAAARARLLSCAEAILADEVPWPSSQRLWLARIARIADRFVSAEGARGEKGRPVVLERTGRILLDGLNFALTARPDRIDEDANGQLHIYDYKSGTPPTSGQQTHFEKQLPLEAAMAERGAFQPVGARTVAAVSYIHLGGDGGVKTTLRDEGDFDGQWAGLLRLIGAYLQRTQGYTARRAMFEEKDTSDYDHLARFGEWDASDDPIPEDVG